MQAGGGKGGAGAHHLPPCPPMHRGPRQCRRTCALVHAGFWRMRMCPHPSACGDACALTGQGQACLEEPPVCQSLAAHAAWPPPRARCLPAARPPAPLRHRQQRRCWRQGSGSHTHVLLCHRCSVPHYQLQKKFAGQFTGLPFSGRHAAGMRAPAVWTRGARSSAWEEIPSKLGKKTKEDAQGACAVHTPDAQLGM